MSDIVTPDGVTSPNPNKAPYTIVRRRVPEGTIRHDDRIVKYWKSKETGEVVEVRRYLRVVPEQKKRVVFFDPTVNQEVSSDLAQFKKDFEPYGNISARY